MRYYVIEGKTYVPMPDSATSVDELPAGYYELQFNKMMGPYFLVKDSIQESPELFGPMAPKVKKCLDTFERRSGSTGVLLSGPKGLGKSLMMRHIAEQGVERFYPVIIVLHGFDGLSDFLAKITQPHILLFDEFDKNFINEGSKDGEDKAAQMAQQVQFLSLLDGLSGNKRLVVATCNETRNLNAYFLNRPGRFFYHLEFQYPTGTEAVAFIRKQGLRGHKDDMASLELLVDTRNINYDCLRAITEELQAGIPFEEAIADLNIRSNENSGLVANVTMTLECGSVYIGTTYGGSLTSLGGYVYMRKLNKDGSTGREDSLEAFIKNDTIKKTQQAGVFLVEATANIGRRKVAVANTVMRVNKSSYGRTDFDIVTEREGGAR